MIPEELTPTRLVLPTERPPIPIEAPRRPSFRRDLFALRQLLVLAVLLSWGRLTGRLNRRRYGQRLRRFLERMGMPWIRAGQLLALRSDLLPAELCAELAELRDGGSAVPFPMARALLEEELGVRADRVFSELDEVPIDTTSISQIHVATLREVPVQVAVRIQHPYARAACARDAVLIGRLVRMLELFRVLPAMRWDDLRQELDLLVTRELDYRYEAASVRQLRRKLRKHGVYVHEVFARYSTPRVLVTEFVRGALMSDVVRLRDSDPARLARWFTVNDIDPRVLARRLFRSVFRQVFEDNFFHADMQPDNIILLRGGRFSVRDCRSASELERESLVRHRMLFEALAAGEYSTAADLYFLLATRLPVVDVADVRAELVRVWRSWETRAYIRELPYDARSIGYMFGRVNDVTFRHRFASRWSLALLARTWANLDLSIRELDPELNCLAAMRRYFRKAERRRTRAVVAAMPRTAARSLIAARDLPHRLAEFDHFRDAIFRRQAQVFRGSTTKVAEVLAAGVGVLGAGLLLAEVAVALVVLDQRLPILPVGALGGQLQSLVDGAPLLHPAVWGGLLAGLLWTHWRTRRARRKLEQIEVRIPDPQAAA
jgi:ubiquinone biosynthesis protein